MKKSVKQETRINQFSVVKALIHFDNYPGDPEDVYKDWNWCKRVAVAYPTEYRAAKSSIMNDLIDRDLMDENTSRIYDKLVSLRDKFGRDSIIFGTLVRAVCLAEFTVSQVNEMRLRDKNLPPAFDKSKRAAKTKESMVMRKKLENYVKSSRNWFMSKIREEFKRELKRLENSKRKVITLTNGTTTAIEWQGYNINDITSIIYLPESLEDNDEMYILGKFFRCLNNDIYELTYIPIPSCERFDTAGGDHMEIPDKDGKIREVYRMFPWIQTMAKAIHKFLDKIAKNLPGNYTYKHRDWIRNLIENNWHRDKYVIGTDMTKYSDTLDRSFIMFCLEQLGIPKKVIDAMNWLYGQDIFDPLLIVFYRDTDATFQGEYGDFPMITIANLILQSFVYEEVNQAMKDGYNAAVGDDTGMVFDNYDSNIMDTIIDIYGCVGVRINRSKTGELKYGKGRIDFVKLEVTSNGVSPFLNMRSICNNNLDSFIRDIFELEGVCKEARFNIIEDIFGQQAKERLEDLSMINGGINDRPITEKDIKFYHAKRDKIHQLLGYEPDETRRILDRQQQFLKEELDEYCEFHLYDTAYVGFLDWSDEELRNKTSEEIDERIKIVILNMMNLGLNKGSMKNYSQWIGKRPSELRAEWQKPDYDISKNHDMAEMWEDITSYETYAAKRKSEQSKIKRKVSILLPVINGIYDNIEDITLPDNAFYMHMEIKSVKEYEETVRQYKAVINRQILERALEGVLEYKVESYNFGGTFDYMIYKGNGNRIKYRMYSVTFGSKYPEFPRALFDELKAQYLQGWEIDYETFYETWYLSGRFHWTKKSRL